MWRYVAASIYVHVLVRSSVCWVIHTYIGWEEVYLSFFFLILNNKTSLPSYHCYLLLYLIGYGPRDSRNRIINQKIIFLVSYSSPDESEEEVIISEKIKNKIIYSILAQKSYTGKNKIKYYYLFNIIRKLIGRLLEGYRYFILFYNFNIILSIIFINISPIIF
jgi:hypothetical protein